MEQITTTFNVRAEGWFEFALFAREELRKARRGGLRNAYGRIANAYGVSEQTTRRVVAASRFIEKLALRKLDIADGLRTVPFSAVEALDRWFDRDEQAAVRAAHAYLSGDESVRSLLSKEVDTRPKAALSDLGARKIQSILKRAVLKHLGNWREANLPEAFHGTSVKFIFEAEHTDHGKLAVVSFGPFDDSETYFRGLRRRVLEAVGATLFGYKTLLVMIGTVDAPYFLEEVYRAIPPDVPLEFFVIEDISGKLTKFSGYGLGSAED